MSKFLFLFLFSTVFCVESWNLTEKLIQYQKDLFNSKSGRLINFDATDGNLRVDLEFSVPFIEVPVQKSVEYAKNFVANVHLPALLLTGFMVVVSAVIIPAIFMFWNKKINLFTPHNPKGCNSSYREIEEESFWKYISPLDKLLADNELGLTSCMERSLCSLVQKSKTNNLNGTASSSEKIIDGVTSNEWFMKQVSNTPFHSAIKNGLKSECTQQYSDCRVTYKHFNKIVREILKFIGT